MTTEHTAVVEHGLSDFDQLSLARQRQICAAIRANQALPGLDRLVAGFTGSGRRLAEAQAMAARVANNLGQPIVTVYAESGAPIKVRGGIITGEVQARIDYGGGTLRVPVAHRTGLNRGGLRVPSGPSQPSHPGDLRVAELSIPTDNLDELEFGDSHRSIVMTQPDQLLIGKAEIYRAEDYFSSGVAEVVAVVLERAGVSQ